MAILACTTLRKKGTKREFGHIMPDGKIYTGPLPVIMTKQTGMRSLRRYLYAVYSENHPIFEELEDFEVVKLRMTL